MEIRQFRLDVLKSRLESKRTEIFNNQQAKVIVFGSALGRRYGNCAGTH